MAGAATRDLMLCPACSTALSPSDLSSAREATRPDDRATLPSELACPHCTCGCIVGYGGELIAVSGGAADGPQVAANQKGGRSIGMRPASTVILVTESDRAALEVLLVRRNSSLAFHGGAWVFPGGAIDPEDVSAATGQLAEDDWTPLDLADRAARTAAAREVEEETGIRVGEEALTLAALWTTPPGRPRRFSTWFFIAEAAREDIMIDRQELQDGAWMTPSAALEAFRSGDIMLPPPTFVNLTMLANAMGPADALAEARAGGVRQFVPRYTVNEGAEVALFAGDVCFRPIVEGAAVDLDAPGPRNRLVVTDDTRWAYEGPPA